MSDDAISLARAVIAEAGGDRCIPGTTVYMVQVDSASGHSRALLGAYTTRAAAMRAAATFAMTRMLQGEHPNVWTADADLDDAEFLEHLRDMWERLGDEGLVTHYMEHGYYALHVAGATISPAKPDAPLTLTYAYGGD